MKIDRWVLATVGHWLVSLVTLGLVPSAAGHTTSSGQRCALLLVWYGCLSDWPFVPVRVVGAAPGEGGGCCPPLTSDRSTCTSGGTELGGTSLTARVGSVAGKFRWLPSFAGGICLGRLESVSCLDGHLLTFSITLLCWVWLCSLLGRVAEKTLVVPKALLGADARGGAFCALG